MSGLTAALYGALLVYLGGWFLGHWTGNFSLLLFVLTVVTLATGWPSASVSSRRARPPRRRWSAGRRAPRRTGAHGHREGRRRRRQARARC
jgi:signal peptidase I